MVRKPGLSMPDSYQSLGAQGMDSDSCAKKNSSLMAARPGRLERVDLTTKLAILRVLVWVPPMLFAPLVLVSLLRPLLLHADQQSERRGGASGSSGSF